MVKRRTDRRRLTRKLHEVRDEQRRRIDAPLSQQGRWLCSDLRGHYRDRLYELPGLFLFERPLSSIWGHDEPINLNGRMYATPAALIARRFFAAAH